MARPLRHLPVVQRWDCHSCAHCCREYEIPVREDERQRLLDQGWANDVRLGGLPLFVRHGPWWARRWRLNHREGHGCVFLSEQNRCLIHERHGADAKPLACRLYPFVLVPVADHWRVSLRFSCPSAAANDGRPLADHTHGLDHDRRELERQEGLENEELPPPRLQGRQQVDWPDLLRFVRVLHDLLADKADRVERRMRKCLALAALCRQARFDQVKGGRLEEFLRVLREAVEVEVSRDPAEAAAPSWVGRVAFRQVLAVHLRKDRGPERGVAARGRLALLAAAWRFSRGRGRVPQLNALIPEMTFEQAEVPRGPLPDAAEELLGRYYTTKVAALQFCGPSNFGMTFWDGLDSLASTLPSVLWMARACADRPAETAVVQALRVVDDHFGYNRILARRNQRSLLRILGGRGEIGRLIAWYSR